VTYGVALLERAVNYTLGSLRLVTTQALTRGTPCRGWDLRALLEHMDDSLLALYEAMHLGRVDIAVPEDHADPATDLVARLRNRACRLIGACTAPDGPDIVTVAGHPLTSCIVTSAGAIEVAVHGWDVAAACGDRRPIPPSLAEELLDLAPLLVTDADRPGRFARAVDVPRPASPSDRLLAFLGRHPG
jgi:uncharacterized protein (TIGR03086 family)